MKNIYTAVIAVMTLFLSSCAETNAQQKVEVISVEEMTTLLKIDDVQLVDVRRPEEVREGYILGAENIAYFGKDWSDNIKHLDKTKPVVVYCKSGGRSGRCRKILEQEGFLKIYDLKGGMQQWKRDGAVVTVD